MSTAIKRKKPKKLKLVLKKAFVEKGVKGVIEDDEDSLSPEVSLDDTSMENLPNNTDISNNDLRRFEEREAEELDEERYPFLYPNLNDPKFNIKIAEKKEFSDNKYDGSINDIEEHSEKLCNSEFELSPHQLFVRNFLSFNTPYNSLLLYHGLGTGKTCSAIGVCEEMRDYMKQMGLSQRIIIVASPNVQENFKLQLFDERKLVVVDGLWNIKACTGNKYIKEINPMNMEGLSKEKVVSQIKRIINSYYLFMGYTEFSNYISKKSTILDSDLSEDTANKIKIKKLKKIFNNRLIVIDEVQNIRISDDNKKKKIAINLMKLVKHIDNLRLLLLSATPMYNSYKEIVWLINLMNRNDHRSEIEVKDIFDKNGNFKIDDDGREVGKELLRQKATGYVSFIRGENPYTFPYRIWPSMFAPDKSLLNLDSYPRQQLNGKEIIQGIEHLDLYRTQIGIEQEKGYNYIISYLSKHTGSNRSSKTSLSKLSSFESMDSFGYTLLTNPLEALNIVYPLESIDDDELSVSPDEITGKTGLRRIMDFDEVKSSRDPRRFNYRYKPEVLSKYGRIFSESEIGKYSSKIKNIVECVKNANGIVLIYSQYLEGGLVPVALALEEIGFTKHGTKYNLLKDNPKTNVGSYIMITGDKSYSLDNIKDIKAITSDDNIRGEKVKVVLISKAGSEGLDFKNIRQVHILEPWYNTNRIEQIIGRAVRTCSHKLLPFLERNVEIYLYGTILSDTNVEAADMYVYRIAEIKSVLIGRVSRVLKQSSVDCILNHGQTNFTEDAFNKTINITLANGNNVPYKLGDKPYSALCDYMESCSYQCQPNKVVDKINLYSYDETFILLNNEKIIQKIKALFKESYVYKKDRLISSINLIRTYPIMQIYSALNQMIVDKNEFITDKYGRTGNLINIGEYYMFQPSEIKTHNISTFERNKPIDYKRSKLLIKIDEPKNMMSVQQIQKDLPVVHANSSSVSEVLEMMKANYNRALSPEDISRGETDWYKFCGHVINQLESEGIDKNILTDFLIAHQVDTLIYNDKMALLNYLYFKSELTEYEELIKQYIDKRILTKNSLIGLFLQKKGKHKLMIKKESSWEEAEDSDKVDLAEEIRKLIDGIIPNLNEVFGFINNFKGGELVFKTKDLSIKRSKGARCDQAGKKGNNGVIKTLNKIIGEEKYTDKNTKGIYALQLCVQEEFMLRLRNKIKHKNKVWFLGPEQASLLNIESYQR